LRGGNKVSVVVLRIEKSDSVLSIVLDGTWRRLNTGNKELVAEERTKLALGRGRMTAEERLADVDFELLDTSYWRQYASRRRLTRPIAEAMQHLGLAKRRADGLPKPTWAAELLFAEETGGLLGTKAALWLFHYKGEAVEHGPVPNLLKPPVSFSGPLTVQIRDAYRAVLGELALGVQIGPFVFEIAQRYPTRVILEAITNAVIHRDYSIQADIHIRLFSLGMDIASPGALPGKGQRVLRAARQRKRR